MKLSKKDMKALQSVLEQLKTGQAFIRSERVVMAVKSSMATTTAHLVNGQGLICHPINKDYGSELAFIDSGISRLERLLAPVETD